MNAKQRIFSMLDRIEDKLTNTVMAHEISEIKDYLLLWQDGKCKDFMFMERLNQYWDSINN